MANEETTNDNSQDAVDSSDFNPFNLEHGASWDDNPKEETTTEEVIAETPEVQEANPSVVDEGTEEVAPSDEAESTEEDYFTNEVSKNLYERINSGDLESAASLLYEQSKLMNLSSLPEEDRVKMHILYENPEFTADEVEDEFNARFGIEKKEELDLEMMTDSERSAYDKAVDRDSKRVAREMKKAAKDADTFLQTLKKEIVLPSVSPQKEKPVDKEAVINEWLTSTEEQASKERQSYLESVEKEFNQFEGFQIKHSDEDVQFDGKYSITPEEFSSLKDSLKEFSLEDFFAPRYVKEDNSLDVNKIAQDVYLLQNFNKILQAAVTQSVGNTKAALIKGIKNIDYSDGGVSGKQTPKSDFDAMADAMFNM
jgi:hypothetical protein